MFGFLQRKHTINHQSTQISISLKCQNLMSNLSTMIQTYYLYYIFSVFFSNVRLSKLNHCAQVALLNSDFFLTKNDDFYLKPKRNSRMAEG